MLVTDDGDLLDSGAPSLKRAGISIAAMHPDEISGDIVLPDALLVDARKDGDWEKILGALVGESLTPCAVLALLPEGGQAPDSVAHPGLIGFERPPCDWSWIAAHLRQLAGAREELLANLGALRDFADQKREMRNLRRIAHYDDLTGLATRRHYLAGLRAALDRSDSRGVALLYIDLDGFKRVNDSLGHWVGDQVLENAADRMRGALRESNAVPASLPPEQRPILGRIGGDEFAIALPGVGLQRAEQVARELVDAFTRPFRMGDRALTLGLSVGVTAAPEHSDQPEELLHCADIAMFTAKRQGGGHVTYTAELGDAAKRNTRLDYDVRDALLRDEFYVHYQPRIRVRDRMLIGAEALARWNSPVLAEVSPVEFIPVAERTGAIVEIGNWVFAQAIQCLPKLTELVPEFRTSVNVSAQQFLEPGLARKVLSLLDEARVAPSNLEIEITESMALTELSNVVRELDALHRAGIHISLDDFGTGFSSLGVLLDLPVDCLKLDRSITRDIHSNSDAASVARAITVMAHGLGISVVAEGVELEAQMRVLEDFACDQVQGFLFSPAVVADDLAALMCPRRTS
jgi:diguanylate cyclase (GGDEF)-like protein